LDILICISSTTMLCITPSFNDVICGGSRIVRCHSSNQRFKSMIDEYLNEYENASKKQRSNIISLIVDNVHNNSESGGFLQKNSRTKKYFVVPDHRAVSLPPFCLD
jgi:hypothetical protein